MSKKYYLFSSNSEYIQKKESLGYSYFASRGYYIILVKTSIRNIMSFFIADKESLYFLQSLIQIISFLQNIYSLFLYTQIIKLGLIQGWILSLKNEHCFFLVSWVWFLLIYHFINNYNEFLISRLKIVFLSMKSLYYKLALVLSSRCLHKNIELCSNKR